MQVPAQVVLDGAAAAVAGALGDRLVTLAVHGSWVAGDFEPGRSDLDLVGVLSVDPDEDALLTLARVHEDLAARFPEWADHIEVDYVSQQAVTDTVAGLRATHPMVRISPGEAIHLTEAGRHYLLNWRSAAQHGEVLVGRPLDRVLPPIPWAMAEQVIVEHLEQWPTWVLEMRTVGAQAYSVLTVCRGAAALRARADVSKRAGADRWTDPSGNDQPLVAWARDWWYAGGSEDDDSRFAEVVAFVQEVVPTMLVEHLDRTLNRPAAPRQASA